MASKRASDFSKVSLDYKTVRYLICATLCLKRLQIGVKDAEMKNLPGDPIKSIPIFVNLG